VSAGQRGLESHASIDSNDFNLARYLIDYRGIYLEAREAVSSVGRDPLNA
jgi:hypothetical protein